MTPAVEFFAASDVAETLFGYVLDTPCSDDGLVCAMRWALDYALVLLFLLVGCVAVGFAGALVVALVTARTEQSAQAGRRVKRVLSGPIHTDGAWVRLVEDERGRRAVEVLQGARWKPSGGDLTHLFLDVPVTGTPASG